MTVQNATTGTGAISGNVLASGPVSYWPLNETSGTRRLIFAGGINNMTYGGTYTLNQTGLRADGNPCVLFTTAAADPANTGAPYNPSLNPNMNSPWNAGSSRLTRRSNIFVSSGPHRRWPRGLCDLEEQPIKVRHAGRDYTAGNTGIRQ